jgi:hypothetical protein
MGQELGNSICDRDEQPCQGVKQRLTNHFSDELKHGIPGIGFVRAHLKSATWTRTDELIDPVGGRHPATCHDEHRPEHTIFLAVDQQFGEGATLRVAPELSDPLGAFEVRQHQDVEELGAGSWTEGVEALSESALQLVGSHGRRRLRRAAPGDLGDVDRPGPLHLRGTVTPDRAEATLEEASGVIANGYLRIATSGSIF